jgi:3D (Asp-Asp-Asp) domain-containing protein
VKEISFKVTPGVGGATRMRLLFGSAVLVACLGCGPLRGALVRPPAPPRLLEFEATAYSETGTTAYGTQTHTGIVAADPAVLPLGSHIRVQDAGAFSGVYTVTDTGPGVKGRQIDIFVADGAEAKRFGRRRVHVEILER